MVNPNKDQGARNFGTILLRTGTILQSSGACTSRIRIILERMAAAYGYSVDILVTHRALSLTLLSPEGYPVFSSVKRTPPVGVNFKVLAGISQMSMHIRQKAWEFRAIDIELERLVSLPHYHRLVVLGWVALADACFCFIAGGNIRAMLLSFAATFVGLFVRQQMHKMHFNPYLCWFSAAFAATFIAGAARVAFPRHELETGFATSVLFLIPGVPLINSFVDMIDGNLLNGTIRLANGLLLSFMIALGMVCSLLIFKF
jgi:uncharacterized membrane protein YjjP (DUF1212 family)